MLTCISKAWFLAEAVCACSVGPVCVTKAEDLLYSKGVCDSSMLRTWRLLHLTEMENHWVCPKLVISLCSPCTWCFLSQGGAMEFNFKT